MTDVMSPEKIARIVAEYFDSDDEEFISNFILDIKKRDQAIRQSERAKAEGLVEALEFYEHGAWKFKINKLYGGLEWSPTEELLEDCGNKAKEALTKFNNEEKQDEW